MNPEDVNRSYRARLLEENAAVESARRGGKTLIRPVAVQSSGVPGPTAISAINMVDSANPATVNTSLAGGGFTTHADVDNVYSNKKALIFKLASPLQLKTGKGAYFCVANPSLLASVLLSGSGLTQLFLKNKLTFVTADFTPAALNYSNFGSLTRGSNNVVQTSQIVASNSSSTLTFSTFGEPTAQFLLNVTGAPLTVYGFIMETLVTYGAGGGVRILSTISGKFDLGGGASPCWALSN